MFIAATTLFASCETLSMLAEVAAQYPYNSSPTTDYGSGYLYDPNERVPTPVINFQEAPTYKPATQTSRSPTSSSSPYKLKKQ